jgi:hypothetical protein
VRTGVVITVAFEGAAGSVHCPFPLGGGAVAAKWRPREKFVRWSLHFEGGVLSNWNLPGKLQAALGVSSK